MGSDNLFHKRKARGARDLARRKARREPYAKVLIVCEGKKTEPYYLKGLRDHYGLNSANIEVTGDCGSDPLSILEHARQRYREERDAGDPYDKVFCVFDKDAHGNYQQTLDAIQLAKPKNVFEAIYSVPCFEYWLLLHFDYTTRPYATLPGNSACTQVLADLRRYMPAYEKGQPDIHELLVDQLDAAIANAQRSLQAALRNANDNPSTRVHELVDYLLNIKKQNIH